MQRFAPLPAVMPMTDVHIESLFNHVEPEEYFGESEPHDPEFFTDEDFTERY